MKKALLIVGIALVSFLAGFVALTYKMPSVAPERAEAARHYVDSLIAAKSGESLPDSLDGTAADTLDDVPMDSSAGAPDSTGQQAAMTALAKVAVQGQLPALRDSLQRSIVRVNALITENQALRAQLDQARNGAKPKATSEEIATLTATLAKLDDKQLRPILEQVDGEVLEELYRGASGRTQARLIQSMPADRAARFVQKLVRGTEDSASPAASAKPSAKQTASAQ